MIRAGAYSSGSTFGSIWFAGNAASPTSGNYAFLGSTSDTYLMAPSGTLYIGRGGSAYMTVSSSGITTSVATSIGTNTTAQSISGSLAFTTRNVSSNLTIDTTTTDYILLVDTSSGAITITLPAPTAVVEPRAVQHRAGQVDPVVEATTENLQSRGSNDQQRTLGQDQHTDRSGVIPHPGQPLIIHRQDSHGHRSRRDHLGNSYLLLRPLRQV